MQRRPFIFVEIICKYLNKTGKFVRVISLREELLDDIGDLNGVSTS